MKERVKFVVVILVYRNLEDLVECIDSLQEKINSCKIVVVNAYYDDDSLARIKNVALTKGCDFYNIENKGYSYGNNYGISRANEKYDYEYVIVSNPDITIEKFIDNNLKYNKVYAPKIIARSGKAQNPMITKRIPLAEHLVYKGLKNKNSLCFIAGIVLYKLFRVISKIGKKNSYKIYQAHGSFVIIGKHVINFLHPIYDENMFLFAEECVMAIKLEQSSLDTIYTEDIIIHHKEDGSMDFGDFGVKEELAKANIYFYEKYILKR